MSDVVDLDRARRDGNAAMTAALAKFPPISDVMKRWDAECAMLRADPVRALLLRIEAIANDRAECHVSEASKLPTIRDLARMAVEKHTGAKFDNPIFPK